MIVYLETSVLLRKLFREDGSLRPWGEWTSACSSEISTVEGYRSIDRIRILKRLSQEHFLNYHEDFEQFIGKINFIQLGPSVLKRAAQPLPIVLSTLDSLHLASALLWQEHNQKEIEFLTHDLQLGRAARAMGLKARGFD